LTTLNKGFAVAAGFFSLMFLWQAVSMLIGIDSEGHADVAPHGGLDHVDVSASDAHVGADHGPSGAGPGHHDMGGGAAFTLVSLRSVIAFATLFSWAGTLYLMTGTSTILSIIYSLAWGLVAMFGVAYLVYQLVGLQETGNISLWDCIGEQGRVYMNVPADGAGKVRVMVGGVLCFVNARSGNGHFLVEGTEVTVTRIVDSSTVEVMPCDTALGE